jgi:hypothetical protein
MRSGPSGLHDWELLIGDSQELAIRGTVHWKVTPGEPMVMYYPDGSGYPGSPPECEFWGVIINEIVLEGELSAGDWPSDLELKVEESLRDHIFENHCSDERNE